MERKGVASALALALALLVSCSLFSTRIGDVRRNPERYSGKVFSVRGKVSYPTSSPFMGKFVFRLDDGTGTLLVVTERDLPPSGSTVTVKGEISSPLRVGTTGYCFVLEEGGGATPAGKG